MYSLALFQLTEDVVNRMRRPSLSRKDTQRSPRASDGTAPSLLAVGVIPKAAGTVGVVLSLHVTEDAGIFQGYLVEKSSLVSLYLSVNISSISDMQ